MYTKYFFEVELFDIETGITKFKPCMITGRWSIATTDREESIYLEAIYKRKYMLPAVHRFLNIFHAPAYAEREEIGWAPLATIRCRAVTNNYSQKQPSFDDELTA